jgi:hypothetical protein
MKKLIIIVSLLCAFIFISHAQEKCDTLKWKNLKSYYCNDTTGEGIYGSGIYKIGMLDNITIDTDTLPFFHPACYAVNVSNDIFFANETFTFLVYCLIYADTGLVMLFNASQPYYFGNDFFPNDTVGTAFSGKVDLLYIINQVITAGIELEQISYWQMVIGVSHTDKDGYYSDSIFYAGADTSTFYVVKTPINIQEIENNPNLISVYPNPAKTQFTVTNTANASLQLYNMLGQEVLSISSREENTTINVDFLPQGVYVLKVVKDKDLSVHKIHIVSK